MFLLDLYRFCESNEKFTRQDLARYVYRHRECARLAEAAETTTRYFASCVSKEFVSRMMGFGYLDGVNLVYWCNGSTKRPFNFELFILEGERNKYIYELMHIEELTDEQLFGSTSNN